jgi:hypothetical protein
MVEIRALAGPCEMPQPGEAPAPPLLIYFS